jgi:hypothetical protein
MEKGIHIGLTQIRESLSGEDASGYARDLVGYDEQAATFGSTYQDVLTAVQDQDPRTNPSLVPEMILPHPAGTLHFVSHVEDPGIRLFLSALHVKERLQASERELMNQGLAQKQRERNDYYDPSLRILYVLAITSAHHPEEREELLRGLELVSGEDLSQCTFEEAREHILNLLPEDTLRWESIPGMTTGEWSLYRSLVSEDGPLMKYRTAGQDKRAEIARIQAELDTPSPVTLDVLLQDGDFMERLRKLSPMARKPYVKERLEEIKLLETQLTESQKEAFQEALPEWYTLHGQELIKQLLIYKNHGYMYPHQYKEAAIGIIKQYLSKPPQEEPAVQPIVVPDTPHQGRERGGALAKIQQIVRDFSSELKKLKVSRQTMHNYGSAVSGLWVESLWEVNQYNAQSSDPATSQEMFLLQKELDHQVNEKNRKRFRDPTLTAQKTTEMRTGAYREHAALAAFRMLYPQYNVELSTLEQDTFEGMDIVVEREEGSAAFKVQVKGFRFANGNGVQCVYPLRTRGELEQCIDTFRILLGKKIMKKNKYDDLVRSAEELFYMNIHDKPYVPLLVSIPDNAYDSITGLPEALFVDQIRDELSQFGLYQGDSQRLMQ